MLAAQGEGGAGNVALGHILGTIAGRSGGFALLHISTLNGEAMWARWPIVPHSGTGGLRTIRGEGKVDIDANGRHTLTLDYELD